ncbi:MAG: NUDIX domain-containing protein [Clostridiales bacterium]|nr:NUDIX domain-containing protein [Clostridiales bacterium]
MKKLNVILVYNKDKDKILMCKREKEPYKGKYNLVGGKVEEGEDIIVAAYRELEEETGITNKDIELKHIIDFIYHTKNIELEVFSGILNKKVELTEEINKLYWVDKSETFFDLIKFAGDGNIGHMIEIDNIFKGD